MTPNHRNVLMETAYTLEHLLWSYAGEIEDDAEAYMTAQDMCLADFSRRSLGLVHALLNDECARRGPRLKFEPPSPDDVSKLHRSLEQRRKRETQRDRERQAAEVPDAEPAPRPPSARRNEGDDDEHPPDAAENRTIPSGRSTERPFSPRRTQGMTR